MITAWIVSFHWYFELFSYIGWLILPLNLLVYIYSQSSPLIVRGKGQPAFLLSFCSYLIYSSSSCAASSSQLLLCLGSITVQPFCWLSVTASVFIQCQDSKRLNRDSCWQKTRYDCETNLTFDRHRKSSSHFYLCHPRLNSTTKFWKSVCARGNCLPLRCQVRFKGCKSGQICNPALYASVL